MKSYFETALETKEAKEAIGNGIINWFKTGSLDQGVNALFSTAEKNGALTTAKVGIVLDVLQSISKGL